MASIVPERSFLGPRLSHGCAGQDYPRRPERSAKTLRARGGDRSRHKRGFPRWCGRIRRADGPDGPPFRRRPNSPGDPLPATKEACEEKAGDRRVLRRLLNREGQRERHRIRQRLHRISKRLVQFAESRRAAIVLEDLTLHGAGGRSRRMNRRLSSWRRREIHRQIEYKAALAGVPVIKVNPAWTSKTCPDCGARRRGRVGKVFVCL